MLEQVRRQKKRHILLPILYTILGLLVLCALVAGYLAMATGFFRPSWVAGMYTSPVPSRMITDVQAIAPSAFEKHIEDALADQALLHPTSTTLTIAVSERDVTGLVQSFSSRLAAEGVRLNQGQVVLLSDRAELYARVEKDGHTIDMLATFVPVVVNGMATLEWQKVRIGALQVSPAFAQSLINRALGSSAASLRVSFGQALLRSIQLKDGSVKLTFEKR
jgi:hypothetical protein